MIIDLLSVVGVIVSGAIAGVVLVLCRGGRCVSERDSK
jgi:hypothetical protein